MGANGAIMKAREVVRWLNPVCVVARANVINFAVCLTWVPPNLHVKC